MNETKKARLRVRPAGESAWCIVGTVGGCPADERVALNNLLSELQAEEGAHTDDGMSGEGILEIGIVQLTDTEVESLGEFDGW
jgi:hypothetical protein